jgi:hypothetical protein
VRTNRNATQVDLLNIGLMLLTCAAAYVAPFELFLFSYAFLGPLHYLTEISWLHDRQYFVEGKWSYRLLGILCIVATVVASTRVRANGQGALAVAVVFGLAAAVIFFKTLKYKLLFVALVLCAALVFKNLPAYRVFFAFLLPNLVHVCVFTGLFILYGALKNRSVAGYLSLVVFVAAGASFFIFNPAALRLADGEYVRASYRGFEQLNYFLAKSFNFSDIERAGDIYTASSGLMLMRFVAFAFTYHYLNWFSKTSIIGWHNISRRRLAGILALWILSLSLYAYDYRTGFLVLIVLSTLHVLLEFPLNHYTILGVGRELKLRAWPRSRDGELAGPAREVAGRDFARLNQ